MKYLSEFARPKGAKDKRKRKRRSSSRRYDDDQILGFDKDELKSLALGAAIAGGGYLGKEYLKGRHRRRMEDEDYRPRRRRGDKRSARKIMTTLNKTSAEIRSWVNTLRRLQKDYDASMYDYNKNTETIGNFNDMKYLSDFAKENKLQDRKRRQQSSS